MSNQPYDINDNEIRIISRHSYSISVREDDSGLDFEEVIEEDSLLVPSMACAPDPGRKRKSLAGKLLLIASVLILGVFLFFIFRPADVAEPQEEYAVEVAEAPPVIESDTTISVSRPFVTVNDTTVNGTGLSVFTPSNATPHLYVGDDILNDSAVALVVQAADVRKDNGKVVGAYILNGELLSKGQAKSGYCAIIGGKINIGVAESTPLLEQALETDGYFFRQYPLVVANQIVENKPKGKATRKALAELNGNVVVVMSHDRLTFHDFSQALVDLGVSNAIYLVGSAAYGHAKDSDGNMVSFGEKDPHPTTNVNYIYWK